MKAIASLIGVLIVLAAGYLLLWPVPIEPVAWTPPPAPAMEGVYERNSRLRSVEWLAKGHGEGPEGIALDEQGRVYTGYVDGTIVRIDPATEEAPIELANTGGRPLGLAWDDGRLWIADAHKGLLLLDNDRLSTASTSSDGQPFRFADDVDVADDGSVYFTDASARFGIDATMADFFEHGATGRVLRYDPTSGETRTVMDGMHFPNGIALGPDDAYLLVNETAEYRVTRYWLKGEKAGTREAFIENLPGYPDNISFNGRDRFWVAIYAPRSPDLDALLPHPFLRKVVFRLPEALHPAPARHGFVLGLDLDGRVVANLQDEGPEAYAPITSAEQHGDLLYLGSLVLPAVGRVSLPEVSS